MALICKNITEDVHKSLTEDTRLVLINAEHSSMLKISSPVITGVELWIEKDGVPHKTKHTITKGVSDTTLSVTNLSEDDVITVDVTGYKAVRFASRGSSLGNDDFVYLITEDR